MANFSIPEKMCRDDIRTIARNSAETSIVEISAKHSFIIIYKYVDSHQVRWKQLMFLLLFLFSDSLGFKMSPKHCWHIQRINYTIFRKRKKNEPNEPIN